MKNYLLKSAIGMIVNRLAKFLVKKFTKWMEKREKKKKVEKRNSTTDKLIRD